MTSDPLIARNLCAERANENGPSELIKEFSHRFQKGLFYQIAGPEVGGKCLMLEILGLLYPTTSGEIIVDDLVVSELKGEALSDTRNRKYGFLFSAPFLLPAFTVLENIAMPLLKIARVEPAQAKVTTERILEMLRISDLASASVKELNRLDENLTALGRAIIHQPTILIAQQLGAGLEAKEAGAFCSLLRTAGRELKLTIIATFAQDVLWKEADVCLNVAPTGICKT